MFTKTKATELANLFINDYLGHLDWFKDIESNISAILLYGSVAKGLNRPDSDIDLLVFTPLEIEEKYTNGEYVYNYLGYEWNIVIRSTERLKELSLGEKDDFQAEVFRESVVLRSADDFVSDCIEKILR